MQPSSKPKPTPTAAATWWHEGVRFECQGSGRCCVSRGQYGFVYVTIEDRRALAKLLKISTAAFTRKYCEKKEEGIWKLRDFNENCRFLDGKMCGVYEARPVQCRTWPWWPEVMGAKAWAREVAAYCPGVGKGPLRTREEIELNLNAQKKSEEGYGT
jgi:Fe-S-cluster containining protein